MFRITDTRQLSEDVFEMTIEAPRIAAKVAAGQFFIVRPCENGERIPFTFSDWNAQEGWIRFVYVRVGKSTHLLSRLSGGDEVADVVGPLGTPSHIESGNWVLIGGGAGIATTYPIARALCDCGGEVTVISGARSKDLLIMQDEFAALPLYEHIVMTDDGSAGAKGLVTEPLRRLCERKDPLHRLDQGLAVGPAPMMKFCCLTAADFGLPMTVSLNPMMVDGTGMCGSCRCSVGGETKFACIDGPDFDGHAVDWEEMMLRQRTYYSAERAAAQRYDKECQCER